MAGNPLSIFRLESSLRTYPWGSRSWIADLLGRRASGEPEAELWLGAHPSNPSRVLDVDEALSSLDRLVAADPERHLGPDVARRFGGRLPLLFKVLAAERPLSLQAHPDARQAQAGFAREEAAGVPLEAPERNYKDAQHKPELLCALTPFRALYGFRPAAEALEVLGAFGVAEPASPLFEAWRSLRESPDTSGLRRFFLRIFELPREAVSAVIASGIARVAGFGVEQARALGELPSWFARLAALYPGDPGVVVALLLRLVELEPGEALFLPAGNLHAYLSGLGLEIMASSDNVLRGGLTHKHVDVAELVNILDFSPLPPRRLRPVEREEGVGLRVARYPSEVEEFELSLITAGPEGRWVGGGPALLLGLEGSGSVQAGERSLPLARGVELFCDAAEPFTVSGPCRFAVATPR